MKTPSFWYRPGPWGVLLAPAGMIWAKMAERNDKSVTPYRAKAPVICVGNLVAGGAGKTPVALSLAPYLPGLNYLSRGHGGRLRGPVLADPNRHTGAMIGDEPLLLAEAAPCWVSRDRVEGARAAADSGARCIVMDDGFQNPSLIKDLSLLVVDGAVGFGNGRCIPAGPLREPVPCGMRRADALVILGEDRTGVTRLAENLPLLRADLEPVAGAEERLRGRPVVAFAGIGRPDKFFATLEASGANLVGARAFPDHHPYRLAELAGLKAEAEAHAAVLVTTAKDHVRLPAPFREQVEVLAVSVVWKDEDALRRVLAPVVSRLAP